MAWLRIKKETAAGDATLHVAWEEVSPYLVHGWPPWKCQGGKSGLKREREDEGGRGRKRKRNKSSIPPRVIPAS